MRGTRRLLQHLGEMTSRHTPRNPPPLWLSRTAQTALESIPCGGLLFGCEKHTRPGEHHGVYCKQKRRMLRGCSDSLRLRRRGGAGRLPAVSGLGCQEVLGAGTCWEVVLEGPCFRALSAPTGLLLPAEGWLVVGCGCGEQLQALAIVLHKWAGKLTTYSW